MTKKHFIALADALRANRPKLTSFVDANALIEYSIELGQWRRDVDGIADAIASMSHRFNREKWIQYIERNCK